MTGARRCILVIEDDPETAEQLVDFLETRGYAADLAVDGNDGLHATGAMTRFASPSSG